jgi:hypothetical protein
MITLPEVIIMAKSDEKHFDLRIDAVTWAKFKHVSSYAGCSVNSQIIQLALECIADYEKEYGGGIELPASKNK